MGAQHVVALSSQAMDYQCRLLFVHQILLFCVAKFHTFEYDRVAKLHQHVTDDKVGGIHVYLKIDGDVGEL